MLSPFAAPAESHKLVFNAELGHIMRLRVRILKLTANCDRFRQNSIPIGNKYVRLIVSIVIDPNLVCHLWEGESMFPADCNQSLSFCANGSAIWSLTLIATDVDDFLIVETLLDPAQ